MLKINRADLEKLGFDLEKALADFRLANEQHPFTINVPAPTAHPMVERAFKAGGFEVIETMAQENPEPPKDPQKAEALNALAGLASTSVDEQLEGVRKILQLLLERLPG